MNSKQSIIDNPSEWVITRHGEFIRIKESQKLVDEKLEKIRERLKVPYKGKIRFQGKSSEQDVKERFDKILEEVNFDYEKFHDWLYDEKNKDKIEITKLTGQDYREAVNALFNYVKSSKQKWRSRTISKPIGKRTRYDALINEESGQIIYLFDDIILPYWELKYNGYGRGEGPFIQEKRSRGSHEKHDTTLIFLHGTGGSTGKFDPTSLSKKFPNLKIIIPHSPILKYDMWHHSEPRPGGSQVEGWTNVTGDVWELMETDVCPNNFPRKSLLEIDESVHFDYSQLRRSVSHIEEIIAEEIANGISPKKIVIAGYSQGGLLTLASVLASQYELGGFVSLCGILPCQEKLLRITKNKNKKTPVFIVNNSGDTWVPFWTGKKTHEILIERGYNVEFKNQPGLGHSWKNEDLVEFLEKCFDYKAKSQPNQSNQSGLNLTQRLAIAVGIIGILIFLLMLIRPKKGQNRLLW